ncbi:MAG TPA: DUF4254 domain-containing protein [Candidatus Omnitrophota bacterium]|nr:DUF4254 domain-containing protein [Candidatus Omnitrophota bacterium]HQJ15652.1 DUF4254 domain-containing protein [Candidatus Omnitrophota bacterium]
MAETLGSLIDKLTIKDIREFHINQMIESKDAKFTRKELKAKRAVLLRQKNALKAEIDEFVRTATARGSTVKDEKLKLYNPAKDIGRIPRTDRLGEAISGLAMKNLQLWHLEDEARRADVGLDFIGRIKKKIDLVNQQRNDYIDRIDELFDERIREAR